MSEPNPPWQCWTLGPLRGRIPHTQALTVRGPHALLSLHAIPGGKSRGGRPALDEKIKRRCNQSNWFPVAAPGMVACRARPAQKTRTTARRFALHMTMSRAFTSAPTHPERNQPYTKRQMSVGDSARQHFDRSSAACRDPSLGNKKKRESSASRQIRAETTRSFKAAIRGGRLVSIETRIRAQACIPSTREISSI